ncbi:Spo0E family sporulation regulatory protein-aspartic acid phosphatase [Anaerophilus nitritogenes]|uniref:Spo0E family sporulation regulatory protein-aspartic acid phosphatase n=1 Tax=Anaerophilus nitritogenes TaxID=2498136 RepID=UPI00101D08F8|nr:Spo0E family sporulation regulatory protein-aspartic acid phosphatase [Anaerophilus nitritogenes]
MRDKENKEIEEIKKEIKRLREKLNQCYIDYEIDFKDKLKMSEDMDQLIIKYYKIIKRK